MASIGSPVDGTGVILENGFKKYLSTNSYFI
jgi:hypothetical protein